MAIPVVSVVGKSGSGKTTLLEKLIEDLTQRGYDVGTVKHHSHRGFDIDKPGKDSWRHARAGSQHVVVAAPDKIASYHYIKRELTLDEITETITDVDIILTEGYMRSGKPMLEVVRSANSMEMISTPDKRFAVASDVPLDVEVPRFHLDDAPAMATLIEDLFLKNGAAE